MMAKSKKQPDKSKLFWRAAISLVGAALILLAAAQLLLYFFGTTAAADVSVRRQGGSNSGAAPSQRYVWSVDYTFTDQSGASRSGHTTRRGTDYAVRTDDRVYYFAFAPFISALESDAEPGPGQLVYAAAGVFLLAVMNRGKKAPKKGSRAAKKAALPHDFTDYDDSAEELYHDN